MYFPRCPRFLRVFRILALPPSAPRRVHVGPRPQRNVTHPQRIADADRTSCRLFAHLYPPPPGPWTLSGETTL